MVNLNVIVQMGAAIIAVFFSAVAHEYCHGYVAYKLGDHTAKQRGRLTFNPFAHIDIVGTILFPLILILLKSPFVFGWAKPVPVNFLNLYHPKRDMIYVSLAGPLINIVLSIIAALLWQGILLVRIPFVMVHLFLLSLCMSLVVVNIILAVFNMIPIPPLDGSRVLMGILPTRWAYYYSHLEPYGFLIIIFLLWVGVIDKIVWPVVRMVLYWYGISPYNQALF